MLSSQGAVGVIGVEVEAAVALVGLAPTELGLQAQLVGRLDLAERRVDLVLQVVVRAKAVGIEEVLADADRRPAEQRGRGQLVTARPLRPRSPVPLSCQPSFWNKGVNSLKPTCAGPALPITLRSGKPRLG